MRESDALDGALFGEDLERPRLPRRALRQQTAQGGLTRPGSRPDFKARSRAAGAAVALWATRYVRRGGAAGSAGQPGLTWYLVSLLEAVPWVPRFSRLGWLGCRGPSMKAKTVADARGWAARTCPYL